MSDRGLNSIRAWRCIGFHWAWPLLAVGLSLAGLPEVRGQTETNRWIAIRSMVVDGTRISLPSSTNLRLAPRPHAVVLEFGPALNSNSGVARIRFKLDGYEERWREYAAEMRLCIRFLNSNGDQVSESEFKVVGQSEGWTGNLETTAFTQRRETIVVPSTARSFWVAMTSAGPPATAGVYALTNLVIRTALSNDAPAILSLTRAFETAAGNTPGEVVPANWMRDGLRPSMAKVFETRRAKGLAIVDDDLNGHAEWHTIKERSVPVIPGDRLALEWSEAYSFGFAGPVAMQYLDLPAGYYRFRINELSVMGISSETEASIAFEVPLAFWRTPWFWVSMLILLLAAGVGGWRYNVWRRIHLQLQQLEQQRAVDRERLRISQDIHDDLGARVTQISLLSAVAQRRPSLPDDARADFGIISQTTRELVSALYETVWAVNPENDNLDALANYLCQMSNQYCAQAQLRCRLEIPEMPLGIPLNSQLRHNLIMAVKEALHNVIKHARATEVRLRIAFEASTLSISIHDDGCGFDPAACPRGNGLGNLQRRLQTIGGSFTVETQLGVGTTVALRLPLAEAPATSA